MCRSPSELPLFNKNGSTHSDSRRSNFTNLNLDLLRASTSETTKKIKMSKKIFSIRKKNTQLQPTVLFRATLILYKLPSIRLQDRRFIRATTVICLSFAHFWPGDRWSNWSPIPTTEDSHISARVSDLNSNSWNDYAMRTSTPTMQ